MKEKARELQRARQEAIKKGRSPGFGSTSNFGYSPSPIVGDTAPTIADTQNKPAYSAPR